MGYDLKIRSNRLVLPRIIRYNYLPRDSTELYVWYRERGINHLTILDGHEQYLLE